MVTLVLLTVIAGIVGLEAYALHLGIDGKLLTTAVGTIAGIGGWTLRHVVNHRGRK